MSEQPIEDGGPAFPGTRGAEGYALVVTSGLTVRDYFAAKALQAIVTGRTYRDDPANYMARAEEAYTYADRMLKAREG